MTEVRPSPKSSENEVPKKLEPIEIQKINGFRLRIGSVLRKWGVILGLSAAAGGMAGEHVQSKFRESYMNQVVEVSEAKPDATDSEGEKRQKGWIDKIRGNKYVQKAKEVYSEADQAIREKVEGMELFKKYRQTKKELDDLRQWLLDTGDMASFWLPFAITFLATSMLLSKILQAHKAMTQRVDPEVDAAIQKLTLSENETRRLVGEFMDAQAQIAKLEGLVAEQSAQSRQLVAELEQAKSALAAKEQEWGGQMREMADRMEGMVSLVDALASKVVGLSDEKEGSGKMGG